MSKAIRIKTYLELELETLEATPLAKELTLAELGHHLSLCCLESQSGQVFDEAFSSSQWWLVNLELAVKQIFKGSQGAGQWSIKLRKQILAQVIQVAEANPGTGNFGVCR